MKINGIKPVFDVDRVSTSIESSKVMTNLEIEIARELVKQGLNVDHLKRYDDEEKGLKRFDSKQLRIIEILMHTI